MPVTVTQVPSANGVYNYCTVCGWVSEVWRSKLQAHTDANEHECWKDGEQIALQGTNDRR